MNYKILLGLPSLAFLPMCLAWLQVPAFKLVVGAAGPVPKLVGWLTAALLLAYFTMFAVAAVAKRVRYNTSWLVRDSEDRVVTTRPPLKWWERGVFYLQQALGMAFGWLGVVVRVLLKRDRVEEVALFSAVAPFLLWLLAAPLSWWAIPLSLGSLVVGLGYGLLGSFAYDNHRSWHVTTGNGILWSQLPPYAREIAALCYHGHLPKKET